MSAPNGPLAGMRIVEGSAFVAAPLGGMTLAQLGADVIRFDQIGGGPDFGRWPLTAEGRSLFWAGMNKGKRSILLDLRSPAGAELATALVTASGEDSGLFLTNFPPRGWMDPAALRARRADLVMLVLAGNADGSSEIDYTVNPATGWPSATGPRGAEGPVNHLLPAWDIAAGHLIAVGLLAAERRRRLTGQGSTVDVALSDVALAMTANLGRLAAAQLGQPDPPQDGNYVFGAYGVDVATADGRRIMVVGLTDRQWAALRAVTGTGDELDAAAARAGVDLRDEGERFRARDLITAIIAPWFAARTLAQLAAQLAGTGVAWGPYRTFSQLAREEPRVLDSPLFAPLDQPGIGSYLMPGSPLRFDGRHGPIDRAPTPGEHTDEVLAAVLGLSDAEVGRLHDAGTVAGPSR